MAIDKAKHAFGKLENVDMALQDGVIDPYDILFVKDADGKPYVGWIDKDGKKVIVQEEDEIINVNGESLPESGEIGKIYIFEENAFVWNGSKFTNLSKSTDVSELESQVAELETEMETKVNATTVQTMIEEYANSVVEVVEF